ncbi:MAG: type II secretion system protein [Sedimentisphaerales bacterium]|nr:type II secretion system protein [Sedimentisphaerales bacterium]
MKWDFRKNLRNYRVGFTLVEVTASLIILGLITATVLVVANRAIATVVLWQTKMEAFDIARENMEQILAGKKVTDTVEYGVSERNPDITWETTIESFFEPLTENMWVRAVCSAEFTDAGGEEQKVELVHWITSLSKKQVEQILEQQQRQDAYYLSTMGSGGDFDDSGLLQDLDPTLGQDTQSGQGLQPGQGSQPAVSLQSEEAALWAQMNNILGPPPEGYEHWGQVPEAEFWSAVMTKFFKK